jgi:hypothetical protein
VRTRRTLLYWSSVVLISAVIIFIWVAVGLYLSGYRLISVHGTSTEIDLYDGDALLSRYQSPSEIQRGNIIAIEYLDEGWKFYLVEAITPFEEENVLLRTTSGCDRCPEWWVVSASDKVLLSQTRCSYAGYLLDFLDSLMGIIFTISVILTLVLVMVFSRLRKAP